MNEGQRREVYEEKEREEEKGIFLKVGYEIEKEEEEKEEEEVSLG